MKQDLLDAALERLERFGPEYGGGMASHGPMASEALHELGRGEAISRWLDRYTKGLQAWHGARARAPPPPEASGARGAPRRAQRAGGVAGGAGEGRGRERLARVLRRGTA